MTTIEVTQENIDKGIRGKAKLCPVSLAISEKCNTAIGITTTHAFFDGIKIELPEGVKRFIVRYDAGFGGLQPFSFELDIAKQFLK